jgi:PAS domain S-box-containing protein
MNQKISAQEKFYQLRKQAEALMTKTDFTAAPPALDDPLRLIHELQTFQIELELQNEELCRSQQELMESNMRYTELYDSAPAGYISVDLKGVILNANMTFADMVLAGRSSLFDQPLSTYIVFENQDIYYQHLKTLFTMTTRQSCELRMKKTDETVFDAQLESTVISYLNGKPAQYRTIVTDISARKKMEHEQRLLQKQVQHAHKMRSMATIAGGIAHDFNNILFIIIGNIDLVMGDIHKGYPLRPKLDAVKAAALRAAGIVKMLLHLSQKTEQKHVPIKVNSVINETHKLLRSLTPATIDIQMHLAQTETAILADPLQFEQILMNLYTNAIQAMEKTGGVIDITVETQLLRQNDLIRYPDLQSGNYVKITVSDNGPGIDPEILDRIFDPYFTTRETGKGSGMGLAVVHGIVENHNGAITVTGKHGEGASFTMLFPMIDEEPEEINEILETSFYGTENLLFVDDEQDIIMMAEETLKNFGYRVEAVTDPKDALALFKLNPGYFDVVVTDMTMPHMTGVQLAEKLIEIRPDIPVILSSGHSSLINSQTAGQIGIAAYMEKPVSISDIAKKIRQIIDVR